MQVFTGIDHLYPLSCRSNIHATDNAEGISADSLTQTLPHTLEKESSKTSTVTNLGMPAISSDKADLGRLECYRPYFNLLERLSIQERLAVQMSR